MPITLVNSQQNIGSASSTTIASAAWANTAGNLLVAFVSGNGADTTHVVTDTAGNTWTEIGTHFFFDGDTIWAMLYAKNCVSAAGNVVTATFGSAQADRALILVQFAGADRALILVPTGGQTALPSTGSDNATSTAATANQNNSLYVGGIVHKDSPITVSTGSGFTQIESVAISSVRLAHVEFLIQGTAASRDATWTVSNNFPSPGYAARVAIFEPEKPWAEPALFGGQTIYRLPAQRWG